MVWAVDGDGCFQMTAQELVTAAAERIPVKIAILNNAYLGMVRQWQEMFYEERYSEVYLSPDLPDYKMWAEAMGCVGMRVESPEEVEPAIEKANEIDDRPVVIDFRTDAREKVFPMVAAGASNDDIVADPAHGEEDIDPVTANDATDPAPHALGPRREQGRRARPRRRPLRPAWLQHLLAWPSPPPTTSASAASPSWSTSSRRRSSRSSSSSYKLINVVKITELDPGEAVERELLLVTRRRRRPTTRGQIIELVRRVRGPHPQRRPRPTH